MDGAFFVSEGATRMLMTTREAAVRANVHFRTVQRWIMRGDLKATRLPGRSGAFRIDRHDLDKLLTTPAVTEKQAEKNKVKARKRSDRGAKASKKKVANAVKEKKKAKKKARQERRRNS